MRWWPWRSRSSRLFDLALVPGAIRGWSDMAAADQIRLSSYAQNLADRLQFEAARGMTLNPEIVTTIVARAAMLVLGRSPDEFRARTVVVHASAVVLTDEQSGPIAGTRSSGTRRLHGQADDRGLILLAWDSIRDGGRDGRWPYDVVIHEFAHSLDVSDGLFDGTPLISSPELRQRWAEMCTDRFEQLRDGSDPGVLRTYGATSTAEFFAVALETLFDRPHELRAVDREFFELLTEVMGIDPSVWL